MLAMDARDGGGPTLFDNNRWEFGFGRRECVEDECSAETAEKRYSVG